MARSIKAILIECVKLADELMTHDERDDIELDAQAAIKHICEATEELGKLYARELLLGPADALMAESRTTDALGTLAKVGADSTTPVPTDAA